MNSKRLLLSLVLSCLFVASANARTIGRQTISVNIPGLTGKSWLSQLIATLKFNGSASVLNANPVLIVLIDDAGNHRISSSVGNPVSMTITYDQVTNQFSINGTPAGVGLAGGSSTTNIPNLFQWTIAVDPAGKVFVQVVEVKDGVTKRYEFFVAEVNEDSYTRITAAGIDRGTVNPGVYSGLMSFLSLLSLPSLPIGVVTVGTPVPIDPPPGPSDSARNR